MVKVSSIPSRTPSLVTTNGLRDIKPPVDIPSGWAWVGWGLGALAFVALLFLAWRYWRKRRALVPPAVLIPPHVRARQKLAEALALIGKPEPFVVAVSAALRVYLEERFEFRAPERTTEEFLHELGDTPLLSSRQKDSLGDFLTRCDLVKFAKYEPGEPDLRDLHASALRLIEGTEPAIAPGITELTAASGLEPTKPSAAAGQAVETEASSRAADKGKTPAIIGTALQLAPCIWIVAHLVTSLRLFGMIRTDPANLGHMSSIFRDEFVLTLLGLTVGIVGLVLLTISLVTLRYRAVWFFWFLIIYGAILVGTPIGIFFLVYCLTKRREFLGPHSAIR